jgi:uncharacterized membrane protein YgcG
VLFRSTKILSCLEAGIRKAVPPLSYGHWFAGAISQAVDENMELLEGDEITHEQIYTIYDNMSNIHSLASSAEQAIIDTSYFITTSLANHQLALRDTYMPVISKNVTEDVKSFIRCKPISFTHLFGPDLQHEIKLVKDCQQQFMANSIANFMVRMAGQQGNQPPGKDSALVGGTTQAFRGRGRGRGRGHGNNRGGYRGGCGGSCRGGRGRGSDRTPQSDTTRK